MAIATGGYVMINAAKLPGTSYALDVQGATNAKGANVRLYKQNGGDAQLVTVQNYGANQVIRFPYTGMVLDVKGGTAKQGQNVMQHPWNKGKNQQWQIVATGNSRTAGGTSYPSYYVRSALNTQYELEAYGTASAVTNGTNLDVATRSTELDHEFVFVPRPILETGKSYRLLSVMDQTVCVGLSGKAGDAAVKLMGVADDNAQRWDLTDDYPACSFATHGDVTAYMVPKGYEPGSGTPVIVAKDNGDDAFWWVPEIVGSTSYNGQQYPIVTIGNKDGVGYVLDVKGAGTAVGTVLQTYARNGAKSQRFIAVPENYLLEWLAAPSQMRVAYEQGGKVSANLWGVGSVPMFVAFVGNTNAWDARYRVRYRKATAGDEVFGAWSSWRNWANGSNANQGWGAGNAASCVTVSKRDPSGTARRYTKAVPFSVTATGNDLAEVQVQVREWNHDGHGAQANMTSRIKFKPTLTVEGFTWSPEGLAIRYHANQKRNNNQLTVYRVTCQHNGATRTIYENADGYPISSCPWQGVATLPQNAMDFVPAEGDTVTAVIRWTNVDGAYLHAKQTATGAVSYDAGRGMALAPTYQAPRAANGYMLHVDASNTDADKWALYIDYGADQVGAYSKFADANGVWDVPVQFGRAFDVYLVAKKGAAWDVWHPSTFAAVVQPGLHLFNFVRADGARDWYALADNAGGPPSHQRTISRDYDAQLTNGNTLEVVHYGNARAAEVNAAGVYVPERGIPHASDTYAERLLVAGYAWYRGPKYPQRVQRVAVVQVTFDDTNPHMVGVSVSARATNNPADY